MNTIASTRNAAAPRRRILQAATERFRRYGYQKTTMAEVAQDAGMSAANLYRYFRDKQDIAAACAARKLDERYSRLCKAVRRPGLTAQERLRALIQALWQSAREHAVRQPRIDAMVKDLLRQRQDLLNERIGTDLALITELLVYGNERGEFSVDDIATTALALQMTLMVFSFPQFIDYRPESNLAGRAGAVANLLVHGLMARGHAHSAPPFDNHSDISPAS